MCWRWRSAMNHREVVTWEEERIINREEVEAAIRKKNRHDWMVYMET